MYAFCVMLNVCVLSHVLYMSFACLRRRKATNKKNSKFPSFAECQHWAKKALPSARGVALDKARKMLQKQPLPQFCQVPQPGTRQRGQFCQVPGGTTRQRLFLKRFFKKMVSLPSVEPWLSAKIQILPSATP
jgi:hypothetical protein